MEQIEFKVCDKDTGKIIGYEFFNTSSNIGYYCLDVSELKEGMAVGDLICHSDPNTLKPLDPMGSLVRYRYTGYNDCAGNKLYMGDNVINTQFPYPSQMRTIDVVRLAHWVIDSDMMINPTRDIVKITEPNLKVE
jgi:hypothetical protein